MLQSWRVLFRAISWVATEMEMPSMWCSRREWVVCAYTGAYRTLNRWSLVIVGVTPQPGGYPSVKGFVCPCAHHHRWSWRPSSSGKTAFFLSSHSHGLKRSSLDCHAESHAQSSWLGLRWLFATGTMLSLIKISFRGFPHPILVTVEYPSRKSFLPGKNTDRL